MASRMSQAATEALGLPKGLKFYSAGPFAGLNIKDAPTFIQDNEFYYIENWVKLGNGALRTVWDVGTPLYAAPVGKTIVYHTFYTIASTYYCFVVLSDGSGWQVNAATGATVQMGSGTPFYVASTGALPYARQWASTYLLISNTNTPNDYWAWDGAILYGAGTVAPQGVNLTGGGYGYGTSPTVTAYGGTGSGMTFTPVVQDGSVVNVNIKNPGSGYSPGDIVQLRFSGGGTDSAAQLQAVLSATGVAGVAISNGGSGYAAPPRVVFSGGGGSGATAIAIVTGGVVTSVVVTNGGSSYTSAPSVSFSGGGGSGAAATSTITGTVESITVTNPGQAIYGFTTVVISGGGGSGATATPTLAYNSFLGYFQVSGVVVTNPGSGYTSAPTVTFTGAPGAAATAAITQAVNTVHVSPGGSGYASTPSVTFTGGGGSGAAGSSLVSLGVTSVALSAGGAGYISEPQVVFSGGGGVGAVAVAQISNGVVVNVEVINPGQDYATSPSVSFVGGGGTGAAALATLTGTVIGVSMSAAGSGYTGGPTVVFSGGGGSGALGEATLTPTFVAAVAVVSGGSGYTLAPTLTITGGGGSGATATASLSGTAIGSVAVGGGGGKHYTSVPGVVISPGANNSAYATVNLMPFGVSGSAFEIFNSRVWIVNPAVAYDQVIPSGSQYQFTAPNTIWNFATSAGGGQAQSTDAFLQTQYVNARQSSGYLYMLGDGSVSSIVNLTTTSTGSPPTNVTTSYQYQNVDPQIGLGWRDSLQEYGRSLVFSNTTGVYGLYGGTVSKTSEKIDQLLSIEGASQSRGPRAIYPVNGGVAPSSAVAHIFNVKYYLNLITILDPVANTNRNVMVAWNEKDWFILSQSPNLVQISAQKIGSLYFAWGTDGFEIFPLFASPSTTLPKKFTTKYYGADSYYIQKQGVALWAQAQDTSATAAGVNMAVTVTLSGIAPLVNGAVPPPVAAGTYAPLVQQPDFESPTPQWGVWGTSLEGVAFTTLGVNLTTTSPDITLTNLSVGYMDVKAYYG